MGSNGPSFGRRTVRLQAMRDDCVRKQRDADAALRRLCAAAAARGC